MKKIIKIEEFLLLVLSLVLFVYFGGYWYMYLIFFFFPDISFLGYLINTKVGAYFYNLPHHKGTSSLLIIFGIIFKQNVLIQIGLIMLGHSSFDRIFGYGLKYSDSFNKTHLGKIGK